MKETLKTALKEAMRARDSVRTTTIRSILAALQYIEMEQGDTPVTDAEITTVLQRELKRRREEMEFVVKAQRDDAVATLNQEIEVIESFLPKALSEEELEKEIRAIASANPNTALGDVMRVLKENFAGQFDGKLASTVAKRVLG